MWMLLFASSLTLRWLCLCLHRPSCLGSSLANSTTRFITEVSNAKRAAENDRHPSAKPRGRKLMMASPDSRPRKRRASLDNSPSTAGNRAAKKRAPRACVSCRDRKVRCDVVNGGVPCTNCRLDDVNCVLKASNRGKRNSTTHQARSRLPSNATARRASSPFATTNTDADKAASGSVIVVGSSPGHGSVATGQPQERRNSRPLAHGDEEAICDDDEDENSRRNHQEAEQAPTAQDAQSQPSGNVHEARREQLPQPRPPHGAVTLSTPSAQPANPPTSDYLVALAFQGKTDAPG